MMIKAGPLHRMGKADAEFVINTGAHRHNYTVVVSDCHGVDSGKAFVHRVYITCVLLRDT